MAENWQRPGVHRKQDDVDSAPLVSSAWLFSIFDFTQGVMKTPRVLTVPSVARAYSAHKPSSAATCLRNRYFWIFPVTVIGNVSTNRIYRGIL